MELKDVLAYVDRCVFEYADRHLNKIEKDIIRWTYEGLSYDEMAIQMQYGSSTLRAVYGYQLWRLLRRVWPNENINKSRFRGIIERLYREDLDLSRDSNQQSSVSNTSNLDLKIIPENNSNGVYRNELIPRLVDTLKSGCRVLLLTGAKGIGKSYLIESLGSELRNHFAQVVYHSTHEAATWRTCYQELSALGLLDLTNESANKTAVSEHQMRQQLLQVLHQAPYLIIIDQTERFIEDLKQEIFYKEITTAINHQSAILWVSAIRPAEINRRVTIETLKGFSFDEASTFINEEYPHLSNSLSQNEIHWRQLVKLCGGSPELLHKSIEALQSFYSINQIEQFTTVLSSFPPSLFKYFESLTDELSEIEQKLLYLFAFNPLSWNDVQKWPIINKFSQDQLMQAWSMLHRRHLLEYFSETDGIYQITPPYLGLYLLQKLREIFLQELNVENLKLFHTYPLSLPTASVEQQKILKNYLLVPMVNTLRHRLSPEDLHAKFGRLISQLTTLPASSCSYAAGSLFNLAVHMRLSLVDVSWANLTLWHADLRAPGLQGLDFKGCQFREAVLMTGVYESFEIALHPSRAAMVIGDSQGFLQVYQWVNNRFILAWCDDLGIPIQQIVITDSNTLIVVLIDQSILIWDTLTRKEQSYSDVSGVAAICSIDLKAHLLAIGLGNREIQLWNLILGEKISEPLCDANDIVRHLAFSPDGRILAGYDNNNSILVWHYNASHNTYTMAEAPLPLNPYGDFLAFQWMGDQLSVIEAMSNDDSHKRLSKVVVRSFTVTDQTMAEDSIDFKVQELEINASQPYQATFSKNGRYLAVCDIDHTVWVWNDIMSLIELITLPELPDTLFISDDGQQLLCQNPSNISIWSLKTQEILQIWETVSDLDQYQDCKFYTKQGFSDDELYTVQRLGGVVVE
ncbi:AAA family ATPase [Leptothoe sp. LEGE 181152]|nr:AAA family ATPase [Leptothoe sp. LEGE 181152]